MGSGRRHVAEADCNLTSGESLVRQILHGKRFMMEEFGVDSKILWLPDVFGYSAAPAPDFAKSGVNILSPQKISWHDTNEMPYDSFSMGGHDGSRCSLNFDYPGAAGRRRPGELRKL